MGMKLQLAYLDWAGIEGDLRDRMRELDAARWAMGEVLANVEGVWGADTELRRQFARRGASMKALAASVGLTVGSLDGLRLTAEAFPARSRVSGVGWAHHHAAAVHLTEATATMRKRWLRDAARHGWSVAQLTRRLKAVGPAGKAS